jgi:hypothetical protein
MESTPKVSVEPTFAKSLRTGERLKIVVGG